MQQLTQIRVGGESDVFRALQMLPGILTSSQISSGLFIRGGSPDQNLILLDGMTVYNPTHLFGFISAF
jgi:TonB-dependent Receptor Plug Domain.